MENGKTRKIELAAVEEVKTQATMTDQNQCPKCRLLLTEAEVTEGRTVYHCWGCGL